MGNVKPITPEEAGVKKVEDMPNFVITAFNEIIIKNLANGTSHFKLKEVADHMRELHSKNNGGFLMDNVSFDKHAEKEHWYDVEPFYRKAGWKVEYDGPGFNESYDATYTFTRKK